MARWGGAWRRQAVQQHPVVLQPILAVVRHDGRLCQRGGCHALCEIALDEAGAGRRHVAHGAQRPGVAARDGGARGGDGCNHLAFTQALGGVVLVIDAQVQQLVAVCGKVGHGVHEPGGQRVGIHRQLERGDGRVG
ncbi:hypothetical protein SDC9_163933 [bioreactor metagenome]|uniref:Uncharacterized protein n=1 Tax=bioreactor metagenome TaxID=1076179 RepID=A0A645FQ85_9ZZZZ